MLNCSLRGLDGPEEGYIGPAQESLDQQAFDHIFGEEGVNVTFSIHEHPPSMGDHLIGGEENRVDWDSTQSVGDPAPS